MTDFNAKVIEEFRANHGRVGGYFEGANMILLGTTGAKTGEPRTIPLMYFPVDADTVQIIASKGGAPEHPAWYHNVLAHPTVHVKLTAADGIEEFDGVAAPLPEPQRTDRYSEIAAQVATFGGYQKNTDRVIPIVQITRTK